MKRDLDALWKSLLEWAKSGEYFRKVVVRTINEFSELEDYQKTLVYIHGRHESLWSRCPGGCENSWNFFGIKATKMDRLLGRYVVSKTKEYINGKLVEITDYFRKYKNLQDGIRGYLYLRLSNGIQKKKVIDLLRSSNSIEDFVMFLVEYRWTTTPYELYLLAMKRNLNEVAHQFIV